MTTALENPSHSAMDFAQYPRSQWFVTMLVSEQEWEQDLLKKELLEQSPGFGHSLRSCSNVASGRYLFVASQQMICDAPRFSQDACVFPLVVERISFKELLQDGGIWELSERFAPLTKIEARLEQMKLSGIVHRVLLVEGSSDEEEASSRGHRLLQELQKIDPLLDVRHTKSEKDSVCMLRSYHSSFLRRIQNWGLGVLKSDPMLGLCTYQQLVASIEITMNSASLHMKLSLMKSGLGDKHFAVWNRIQAIYPTDDMLADSIERSFQQHLVQILAANNVHGSKSKEVVESFLLSYYDQHWKKSGRESVAPAQAKDMSVLELRRHLDQGLSQLESKLGQKMDQSFAMIDCAAENRSVQLTSILGTWVSSNTGRVGQMLGAVYDQQVCAANGAFAKVTEDLSMKIQDLKIGINHEMTKLRNQQVTFHRQAMQEGRQQSEELKHSFSSSAPLEHNKENKSLTPTPKQRRKVLRVRNI